MWLSLNSLKLSDVINSVPKVSKGEMCEGKELPFQPWYVVGEVRGGVFEGLVDVLGGEVLELSRCA